MSNETLFTLSNLVVLPFWFMLILLPHWRVTQRIIASPLIALPTALLYAALVLPQFAVLLTALTNPSLADISKLLSSPAAALIAWAHFLTFDLLAARWAYLESRAQNYSALLMAPVLFLILMFGPLGFVFYLILRYVYTYVRTKSQLSRSTSSPA